MMGHVSPNVKLPTELKAYNCFPGSIILEFHYEPSQDQQSASSNVSDDEHSDVSTYELHISMSMNSVLQKIMLTSEGYVHCVNTFPFYVSVTHFT